MPLSDRFKKLKTRLRELRTHLLPAQFSPVGNFTDREQDRARGYRLLVHAEIESYLEDISRSTVTAAIAEWRTHKKPSVVIVSFLASYHSSWYVSEEVKNADIIELARNRKGKESIEKIIQLAQDQFLNKIKLNHGIKDRNFKTLILPLGIDIDSLDQTWLTNLDSFGSKRGEVAHTSKYAQGSINPKDEFESVLMLLSGIKELDQKIMSSRSRADS